MFLASRPGISSGGFEPGCGEENMLFGDLNHRRWYSKMKCRVLICEVGAQDSL